LEDSVVTALLAGIVLGELWSILTRPLAREPASALAARAGPILRRRYAVLRRTPAKALTTLPTRKSTVQSQISAPLVEQSPAPAPQPVTPSASRAAPLKQGSLHGGTLTTRMRLGWGISAVGILFVVWWAGSITLPRYFVAQAQSRGTWGDMNAPQAVAARDLREAVGQYHVYMSPAYIDTPALSYLAANTPADPWVGMNALPFPSANGRPVMLILDPPEVGDLSYIAHLYPHATFDPLRTPSGEGPMMFAIRITAADIETPHGVRASLRDTGATKLREERTLPGMLFDWGSAGGHAGTLRLSATLRVDQYGPYGFNWQPSGSAAAGGVLVDGYPIMPGQTLPLAVGLHSVVATDTVTGASGIAQLRWTPPGGASQAIPTADLFDPRRIEPHGLTGLYRAGTQTTGAPQTASVDAVISFFFNRPAMLMSRPYNVEWLGRLYVPQAGAYQLGTEQITNSELSVDGKEVIVNKQPNQLQEASLTLSAGWHDLHLHYVDAEGYAHIYLYWTPPGRPHSIIPAAFLWPLMGQYPTLPESGAWPTLNESDGSVLPGS
ncbi:MAG: PA14 domain-containing protein, partial [Chloroflexota bacterium]|nr:PA14 domain-containing protein [Chloroflexota bacterium]